MKFEYPEGATPIDPDEAKGLQLTHITTQGELNRWEQDNILEAKAWADKTKPADILNEKFIKAGSIRKQYIESLHAADGGNYEPLLTFVRT